MDSPHEIPRLPLNPAQNIESGVMDSVQAGTDGTVPGFIDLQGGEDARNARAILKNTSGVKSYQQLRIFQYRLIN
jgi:hypothetical protein